MNQLASSSVASSCLRRRTSAQATRSASAVTDGGGSTATHADDYIERLIGGQGDDTFDFSFDNVQFAGGTGTIDGNAGIDTLDYSAFNITPVIVSLIAGTATNTGGISNIEGLLQGTPEIRRGLRPDSGFTW